MGGQISPTLPLPPNPPPPTLPLPSAKIKFPVTDALHDLADTLTILDGATVIKTFNVAAPATFNAATSPAAPATTKPAHATFTLANFFPFGTGLFTLQLQITHPAPNLAGLPQQLTAQYQLCGMEKLPETLEQLTAAALWLLTLLLATPTAINLLRFGLHAKP